MLRFRPTPPVLTAVLVALAMSPAPRQAGADDLDPTFGVGGIVLSDYAAGRDWASDVAIQPDGKLVVVGTVAIDATDSAMAVARYYPNGTLDLGFGAGGWATVDVPGAEDVAYCVLILENGRILIGGLTHRHWALARLLPNGNLDPSFGDGGHVVLEYLGGVDWIRDLAIQPDGKIIAGGMVDMANRVYDFAVGRLHPDGTLDSTFGAQGRITTDLFGWSDYGESVVLQSDGKIVLAGRTGRRDPTDASMGVVRYTPDGALDASFGSGGIVGVDFGDNYDLAYKVVRQDDGRLIVVGHTGVASPTPPPGWLTSDLAVVRLDASGNLDAAFDDDGRVVIDLGGWFGRAFDGVVEPDGKITIVGYRSTDSTSFDGDLVLARVNPDGSADGDFGEAGVVVTDVGGQDHAYALALDAGGRIVAAGRHSSTGDPEDFDFAVVRYRTGPLSGVEGLIETVEGLIENGSVSPAGRGTAWLAVLDGVVRALERGNEAQAIQLLETFSRQVATSIRVGAISAEDGALLIEAAQALIDSISG